MVSQLIMEIFSIGQKCTLIIVSVVALILLLIQIGWIFYRWVVDANTEWEKEAKSKKIFCGNANWLLKLKCSDTRTFTALILVCWAFSVTLSLVWPIAIIAAILYTFGYCTRGCLRFKRKINNALGNKADKDHEHDDKYERKASDGAVNV